MPARTPEEPLTEADEKLVDAAVRWMAAEQAATRPPRCESHDPSARLLVDLPLANQLEAMASCLPCDWPASFEPGTPIARILNMCATAVRDLICQRDEAALMAAVLHVFNRKFVPSYSGSPLDVRVKEFLAKVDGGPAYADPPCTCKEETPTKPA